jgi:hypothetical protein
MFLRGRPLIDKIVIYSATLMLAVFIYYQRKYPLPPPSPEDQQRASAEKVAVEKRREQEYRYKQYLCRAAAACKKYDEVRLECATAGSFKTCLRIKMGKDADYSESCSGYIEGAPAVPRPPETPNVVECFFVTLAREQD